MPLFYNKIIYNRWEGYIKIPITGLYTFTTVSDDGNMLFINDQEVLSHNMGAST